MRLFRHQTHTQSLLLTAALSLLLSAPVPAQEPAEPTSPNYIPAEQSIAFHQIHAQIFLSLNTDNEQDPQDISELRQHLQNHWGDRVRFEILTGDTHKRLSSVSVDLHTPERLADTEIELELIQQADQSKVLSRRWLRLTDDWVPGPEFQFHNPDLAARYLARAAAELLQPVVHIQKVEADSCAGTAIAGERMSPKAFAGGGLEPGQLLQPMLLYSNREGELVNRQSLPWTYLEVDHLRRARMTANTFSAFRAPLPAARRRVEIFATRVFTHEPATIITVSQRGERPRVFPLAELLLSPWHKQKPTSAEQENVRKDAPESPPKSLQLTCDRQGRVRIDSEDVLTALGTPLVKIEVLSGDSVVARVPWVIGSAKRLELTVPDDTARLAALEGLDQIETDLLRVTAKRATLLAALRQLADQASDVDASALWTELIELPGREQFQRRITLVRVTSTEALLRLNNRTAARQIEKACEQTSTLVEKHLSNEDLDDLKQQLNLESFLSNQTDAAQEES